MRLFISYAGPDRPWAEWIAWQLDQAGHDVELDVWDWAAGDNLMQRINAALDRADKIVALFSSAYFQPQRYTTDEWTAVLSGAGRRGRLIPLRVDDAEPPPVLRPLLSRALFGTDDPDTARRVVLSAVNGPTRPATEPAFPASVDGSAGPPMPGTEPRVWSVPRRNASFVGREDLMADLHHGFSVPTGATVQALYGPAGVGKTALAIEYAHRFAASYDLLWWIDAIQEQGIQAALAELGMEAGWTPVGLSLDDTVAETRRRLRTAQRWLLIFDNAEHPDSLERYLPFGTGHLLLTSRRRSRGQLARPIQVDVFSRSEAVACLRLARPTLTEPDAEAITEALGGLPTAVSQAAAFLAETGIAATELLRTVRANGEATLHQSRASDDASSHPTAVALSVVALSVQGLHEENPAATQLLHLWAFLPPDALPAEIFTAATADALPEPLASQLSEPLAVHRMVAHLSQTGLAQIGPDGPRLPPAVADVVRAALPEPQTAKYRAHAAELLALATPDHDRQSFPH